MKSIPTSEISRYCDRRSLVSVERARIDSNAVHGFIIDFDEDWILLQHVYDFFIDGWVLLRRSPITKISSKATDSFHKRLLEEEGKLSKVNFTERIPSGGVPELLKDFDASRVVILEEETEEEDMFYLGLVRGLDEDDFIRVLSVSGVGEFDDEETLVALEDLTSISYDKNYTLHYQRFLDRQ
ncbi:hypothetical protein [Roseibacillus persicicus]|uniref:hypothetical protein n=1 Tax=Roseibacillus persicicus TaxID=454148 RepID=UPI0035E4A1EF